MSDCVYGNGYVKFKSAWNKEQKDVISEMASDYNFWLEEDDKISFSDDEEFSPEVLDKLKQFDIKEGDIYCFDEYNEKWRYVFRNDEWVYEEGHTEYGNSNLDMNRLVNAFVTYINDDLAVTETEYVRDKLLDMCGLTKDELKEIGLGYLLDEEED